MDKDLWVELRVHFKSPLCQMLWASIPDIQCPRGDPMNATILGHPGVWRVRRWKKEGDYTTFGMINEAEDG